MAEEQVRAETVAIPSAVEQDKPKLVGAKAVHAVVAEQVAQSGPRVRQMVVDMLVGQELSIRKEAVLNAISTLDIKEKELKKLSKSGVVNFTASGDASEPFFTKEQHEQRKKLQEEINSITNLISNALEKNDFGKLVEKYGKSGN